MKTIIGQNNYAVKLDQSGTPIDGIYIEESASLISNTDQVTTETIAIEGLTTPVTDWALNHASENGISGDMMLVDGRRSVASDEAVNKLANEGITVITEQ